MIEGFKVFTTTEEGILPSELKLNEEHMPTKQYVIRVHNLNSKQKEYRWYQSGDSFELVKQFAKTWDKAEVYEDLNKGKGKPYYHHAWSKKD